MRVQVPFHNGRRTERSIENRPGESGFSIRDYASLLHSEMKVNIHRVTHFLNRVLPEPQWGDCWGNGHGAETMWQRGVPKIQIAHQIAVCSVWKSPESLENNKEFWMGKHKGFHRALYWLVLDELKWLWLLAEFPGAHWRQFQAVVAGFSGRNVLLMSGMNDIMFHNLAVIFSIGRVVYCRETTLPSILRVFFVALLDSIYWRVTEEILERMTCNKGHSPDLDSPYQKHMAYSLLCWASRLSRVCKIKFCVILCTSVLWFYGMVICECWLMSPMEWPWGECDWA